MDAIKGPDKITLISPLFTPPEPTFRTRPTAVAHTHTAVVMSRLASACLALTLSCASGFIPPAPHASFPRPRARESRTAVDLHAGGGACGEEMAAAAAAAIMPDTSSSLQQHALTLDTTNLLSLDLSGAMAHHGDGGGALASAVTPLLVASAAPGNPSTASGLFGIAALVIALGAGALVFSTVTGKNGLGAFLTQEKGTNPFYQDTMAKYVPKTPDILNKIRLPDLDFVDVYNQPPSPDDYVDMEEDTTPGPTNTGTPDPNAIATAESLRQKLLMAVQAKDYDLASSLERELANFMRKNGMGFEGDQ